MNRTIEYTIPESQNGLRVEQFSEERDTPGRISQKSNGCLKVSW